MSTQATKDLVAAGEAIEDEVADTIASAVKGLSRWSPDLDASSELPVMTLDYRGDYILRDEVLDAIRDAIR